MANIYPPTYAHHHQLDFHPKPVIHAPSPLGFGFGLASTSFTPAALSPHNHQALPRPQKRRHDPEDDENTRPGDEMDRSPTPERPRRAAPKRLRVTTNETPGRGQERDNSNGKENKPNSDVDVGVLLASLPQQSLLPLLTALLREKPELKPTVLSLLPRPALETALRALADASKTLRDAYPYSACTSNFGLGHNAFSHPGSTPMFGFSQSQSLSSHPSQASQQSGGMRDSYIISRLRPRLSEFASMCFSYLPYFSYLSPSSGSTSTQANNVKPHAQETFTFLSTLMSHVFSQPHLARNELHSLLYPRLIHEWRAWVDRVDEVVNRECGMFSLEVAKGWERSLDEYAEKDPSMKEIRDLWVLKVGWLVARRPVTNMDEDEEL